jgi:hypothetical protein
MTKSFIFKNNENEYYELSYSDAQFLAATAEQVDKGVLPEVTAEDVDKFCFKEGWHNFYDLAKKVDAPENGEYDGLAN